MVKSTVISSITNKNPILTYRNLFQIISVGSCSRTFISFIILSETNDDIVVCRHPVISWYQIWSC